MSAFLTGLIGEVAPVPFRVFLGTQPALSVETRLLRQFTAVSPWYFTRKRIKEAANEFVELDLASADAEIFLRYSHIDFLRRAIFEECIAKQVTFYESAKNLKQADQGVVSILADFRTKYVAPLLVKETDTLRDVKLNSCKYGSRRELHPESEIESSDFLAMMRVFQEDNCGEILDAEMKAKMFLPLERVLKTAHQLARIFELPELNLEKRDEKLLKRMILPDYTKIGCVEKLRPVDVSTLFRFCGERCHKVTEKDSSQLFRSALWGSVFYQFATNPYYLANTASTYWAKVSGLDSDSKLSVMPLNLAEQVCRQQTLFPALQFNTLYTYLSADQSPLQNWKAEPCLPLMRLFPLLGKHAGELALADLLAESLFVQFHADERSDKLLDENVLLEIKNFVSECCSLRETDLDRLGQRILDSKIRLTVALTPAKPSTAEVKAEAQAP